MMRRTIMVLGVLVALMPYLGFPESFATVFYTLAGMIATFLAWNFKTEQISLAELAVMEEELERIAGEPPPHEELSEQLSPGGSAEVTSVATVSIDPLPMPETPVAVSFEKRKRNLKKRITRVAEEPLP